jgi:hypothetical protein
MGWPNLCVWGGEVRGKHQDNSSFVCGSKKYSPEKKAERTKALPNLEFFFYRL